MIYIRFHSITATDATITLPTSRLSVAIVPASASAAAATDGLGLGLVTSACLTHVNCKSRYVTDRSQTGANYPPAIRQASTVLSFPSHVQYQQSDAELNRNGSGRSERDPSRANFETNSCQNRSRTQMPNIQVAFPVSDSVKWNRWSTLYIATLRITRNPAYRWQLGSIAGVYNSTTTCYQ